MSQLPSVQPVTVLPPVRQTSRRTSWTRTTRSRSACATPSPASVPSPGRRWCGAIRSRRLSWIRHHRESGTPHEDAPGTLSGCSATSASASRWSVATWWRPNRPDRGARCPGSRGSWRCSPASSSPPPVMPRSAGKARTRRSAPGRMTRSAGAGTVSTPASTSTGGASARAVSTTAVQ